jgi:2-dehydropantoate 2-reductase
MNPIIDVCVIGIGGIGSCIGGVLCAGARKHNAKISFIARGPHLDAIRQSGLSLSLPGGREIICRPDHISSRIDQVPRPQLIFIAVKTYDLPAVLPEIACVIDSNTSIIPLMNGFDIYERIRQVIKTGFVFPSCVIFGGRRTDNGKSSLYLPGPVFFGPDPMHWERIPADLLPFLKAFDDSPVKFNWVPDPYPVIWQKYMGNVALNLVDAYLGKTVGEILADPELKQLVVDILRETAEVIAKKNIPLPGNVVESVMALIRRMPYDSKSSYAIDIESGSQKNEGDIYGIAIIDLARQVGVATPKIERVFSEIQKKIR